MSTIDVWCVAPDLIPVDEWAPCEVWVDDTEYARALQYRFERDRRLFLVGRALLRASLSRRAGRSPAAWRFTTDANGRTLLADGGPWAFSVSHTAGAVVCALGEGMDLGIDIEYPYRGDVWEDLISTAFTAGERSRLALASPSERVTGACWLWTLKEAYAKARGLGLALPFDRIGFNIVGESILFEPSVDVEPEPSKWSFRRFEIAHQYCGAVSWTGPAEVSVCQTTGPLAVLSADDTVTAGYTSRFSSVSRVK